jgi:hypothetical protein
MGERNKRFDGHLDCIDDPVGGLRAVFRYEFSDSVKINLGFRMKSISLH